MGKTWTLASESRPAPLAWRCAHPQQMCRQNRIARLAQRWAQEGGSRMEACVTSRKLLCLFTCFPFGVTGQDDGLCRIWDTLWGIHWQGVQHLWRDRGKLVPFTSLGVGCHDSASTPPPGPTFLPASSPLSSRKVCVPRPEVGGCRFLQAVQADSAALRRAGQGLS